LSSLKNLAGQTIWYGLSTIMARLIGFLLNPLITYLLNSPAGTVQFGEYSTVMAYIPFLNVLFTYGMETAYFRFSNSGTDKGRLFRTSFSSIILSTIILSILLFLAKEPIAHLTGLEKHPEYITWTLWVIALDTLSVIPFAKLRQEGRPRKYAFVKVAGVVVNILLVILLVGVAPRYAAGSDGFFARWYHQYTTTGFLIMAFIAQSAVTLLLLAKEWMGFRFKLDLKLWRSILKYSLPFVIIGLGGMVNEVIDRIMLLHLYKGTEDAAKAAVGIYNANYKVAIFITLFIQAFKMAAEPFFFSQAADKNAPKTYAKVMKWFVITLCLAFLFTALFLDVWKYLNGSQYRSGLGVVPILLFANISLGIYYNLAVWYKITAQLKYGIYITLVGAAVTLTLNYLFIPVYGMYACAWATLTCYTLMVLLCYYYGQKYFPVPYPVKKLLSYIGTIIVLFFVHEGIGKLTESPALRISSGVLLGLCFVALVFKAERKELKGFPVIGKYL
jgi:O-antigen/teichoic acid export membrane protein